MTPPVTLRVHYENEDRTLKRAFFAALAVEVLAMTGIAWQQHWLAHPAKTGLDDSRFVEAQIFEMPQQAQLTMPQAVAKAPEAAISLDQKKGRKAKVEEKKPAEENKGTALPAIGPTHGAVPIYNPAPVIPSYLQSQDINASVVFEFLVSAQGAVTPRLLASSGNDELDAIALSTVKQWQFRPAEKDHTAIDSKFRLRIVFEVH